jgi:hypothetical protein
MNEKFEKSYDICSKHRQNDENIIGYCLWQVEQERFFLESWQHKIFGTVIFQVYPDGNGFKEFYCESKYDFMHFKNLIEISEKLIDSIPDDKSLFSYEQQQSFAEMDKFLNNYP